MLILAATPIGNIGDASARLIDALSTVDVIAAEDTRTTLRLLSALNITRRPTMLSMHEHNEHDRIAKLLTLARDSDVLIVSDAGMPTISDPGYQLVEAAVHAGVPVTVLPGPSAVITALAVSGLPTDRFTFEGFVPRKSGERRTRFRELAHEPRTMVFFESPNRIAASLRDLAEMMGADRRIVVCRELTKRYEEVRHGTAIEVAEWAENGVRGEIVIVIAGAPPQTIDLETGLAQVLECVASGVHLKDAVIGVASETGLGRRELYEAALRSR
jgi:16S rRNA (cytidine1402-2'-O)-methyltransferase